MKVLLIYPSVTIYGLSQISPHIPIGLVYIATFLKKHGHDVKILDCIAERGKGKQISKKVVRYGLKNKEILRRIEKYNPDIVGISVMYSAYEDDGVILANKIKEKFSKLPVVLGGSAVSINPMALLKSNKKIDYAVKGEGEDSMLKLIESIEKQKGFEKVSGLVWRKKGKIVINPIVFVKNLDDFPFPDYHFLDLKKYFINKDPYLMRHRVFPIVTSRGCPNHCVYCSIHSVYNHRWRGRSAKNVVDEMKFLVKEFGVNAISVQDDSMSVDIKRLKSICKLMIKNKLDIKWATPNGIAHWTLDEEALDLMKKAGCYRITFGIESGNKEIRKWIGKPYDLKQATEMIKYANKIGLWTLATHIIGFPYENREQIEDTINYAISSDVDFALFFRLNPRPGTQVYDVFKKEGWLPKNKKYLLSEDASCKTRYFKRGQLLEIQTLAYRKFLKKRLVDFLRPIRIIRKIQNFEDFKYVFKLGFYGLKMGINLVKAKTGVTSKVYRS